MGADGPSRVPLPHLILAPLARPPLARLHRPLTVTVFSTGLLERTAVAAGLAFVFRDDVYNGVWAASQRVLGGE
jgi:hypothetical protein